MNTKMIVEFIPKSPESSTFIAAEKSLNFPNDAIGVLSHFEASKTQETKQEYIKKMALQTAINYKEATSNNDVDMSLKNCPVECFIADLDSKLASLITDDDLKMFD